MERIKINLNRKKIRIMTFICLLFLVISLLFVFSPDWFISSVVSSRIVILIFGILGSVFFGMAVVFQFRRLTNPGLGLFLDDKGLTDNSNSFRYGLVEWADIKAFKRISSSESDLILIETDCPEKYISNIKSPVFRKAAGQNLKHYGTPLIIWCRQLESKPAELEKLLNTALRSAK